MNKLNNLIKEHKKGTLVAIFLLIVFLGFSVTNAVSVADRRAQESAQQTSEQQEGQDPSEPPEGSDDLTDTQKAAISDYDDQTKAFIDTLCANVWSSDSEGYTLRFSGDHYVESVGGNDVTHSYAILRLDKGSDTTGMETDTVVFETDTGTHVVSYTFGTGSDSDGSGKVASTLTSATMFAIKNATYTRVDAVRQVSVRGLNSEVTSLLGGDTQSLTTSLSNWCSTHYPNVTTATWNQIASIDWENNVITTGFTLTGDDSTNSPVDITVVYQMDTGSFEFGL